MKCPSCGETEHIWKDGFYQGRQRYQCALCGRRFLEPQEQINIGFQNLGISNPTNELRKTFVSSLDSSFKEVSGKVSLPFSKNVTPQVNTDSPIIGKPLNSFLSYYRKRRNLMQRAIAQQKLDAHKREELRGLVLQYTFWLKKEGYKESTIRARTYIIQNLVKRNADLLNPESVKDIIAKVETWSESRKKVVTDTYTNFLSMLGLTWEPPRYKVTQKIPFIPIEKEIDDLIANAGPKTSPCLKIAKETGARIGEILQLKWIDLDEQRRTIKFEAEKGSNPRILSVSSDLIAMLKSLPKESEYIFSSSTHGHALARDYGRMLALTRKTLARKLQNPRLLKITFHTIRHWKGTIEYHKTKDIIHVQQLLGHKNINNTMIYINLERAIFKESNDEFIVRAVDTLEEACKLMEVGFEYVCDMDDKKLFRKRK